MCNTDMCDETFQSEAPFQKVRRFEVMLVVADMADSEQSASYYYGPSVLITETKNKNKKKQKRRPRTNSHIH